MVSRYVMQYLALFRADTGRGLRWPKARRLLEDLGVLVREPLITWDRKAPRPNTAKAWGLAMERLLEKPPKNLPLESHGYLRRIAYDIADELDKVEERRREIDRQGGRPGIYRGMELVGATSRSPLPDATSRSPLPDATSRSPLQGKLDDDDRREIPVEVRDAIRKFTGEAP
jgi:hypothetical protein